ncbi:MAG: Lysosomal alpha-mannosidase [Trebouxia sp. A1-2]|nr:MAG: Lysosomal alpha-mannosidase [Trebouxia sp. A1-2]
MRVAKLRFLLLWVPLLTQAQPCVPAHYKTNASRVEGKLNVHLVPHTHDDSGWLKTMDQYYYGSNNKMQLAAVQYILDTVIQALDANPDRKFVYGEMSFFTRWWREQSEATKDLVRKLVDNGQLDFVNGGYVQHDEAAAHYVAMIDQTTRGHSFIKEQFGKVPTIGWQLDPFGHSATHAALMCGLLGFDGLFFGRADYQDMDLRKPAKQMEMLWRGAKSFGDTADVFTSNFPTGNYGAPGGFWYDPWSQDDPIMDDKCLYDYNVQNRVDDFVRASKDISSVTYGDDILIPFGSDFQWISAHQYYKNVDKLIHYINADGRINAFYSTPAEYVAAKHTYNHSWPLKTDDFFPYADCPVCYWTGYFTSRATSKGWIREATAYLQAARQLEVLTQSQSSAKHPNTDSLEEAVSLLQHHDAITGTEKQHVTDDYHVRLARGWKESQKVFTDALAQMVTADSSAYSDAEEVPQHVPGNRRLLATAPHSTGSAHASAQPGPEAILERPGLTDVTQRSTAGSAGPVLNSNAEKVVVQGAAASAHTAQEVHNTSMSFEDSQEPQLSASDQQAITEQMCSAHSEVSTVCADKDQPVAAPQPWEQEEEGSNQRLRLQQCQLLNASVCEPSVQMSKQGQGFMVVVYNALAWERPTEPVRVPLDTTAGAQWAVTDPDGQAVESQLVPVAQSSQDLQSIMVKEGLLPSLDDAAQDELVFLAHLPPVGYAVYTIQPYSSEHAPAKAAVRATMEDVPQPTQKSVESDHLATDQNQLSNAGGEFGPASGAYIFRPDGVVPRDLHHMRVLRGPVVSEIHHVFSDYTSAVIRVWDKALHVEVEWTVGPIPINDKKGKEVVLRYASSLHSGATFYTDSNGREYLKRVRDFRPTWNLSVTEPVSGNYYPLTAGAYIQESGKAELAVLTDRAQGGASLASGELEIMVHRRTLFDDWRGVAEPLNETMQGCMNCHSVGLIARGKHWLTLQDPSSAALIRRTFQQRMNDPPILSFGALPKQARPGQLQDSGLALRFSAVSTALPLNVHLLTLKALPQDSVLLRLAHLYQVDEHPDLAKSAQVELHKLFAPMKLSQVSELSLSANQLQSDVQRLRWQAGKSMSGDATDEPVYIDQHPAVMCKGSECFNNDLTVVLNPMEIKTFLLQLA